MTTADDEIVSMKFDNATFEKNLSDTIKSLDSLRQAIERSTSARGLTDIQKASDNINLSHMANAVDNIGQHFSALGVTAFTVIQNITTSAIQFGKNIADKVIDPIISGGTNRAKNIEQAKFMFKGLGIDIQKGMQSSLDAVKGTAFGLDEAAKAAAQFGASGIKVGSDMTAALRGVAGAAAMTGTSFTEIADIFAGSAGSGKVNNMDLMQFATRGLNAAAAIGKVMGKTEAEIHQMAADGELDFKTFAGAMDQAFGKHATEANQTYTGSLANMHAALSRLGAAFITPHLEQQRDLFNALTTVIDNVNVALQPMVYTISKITGGATAGLIKTLQGLDFTNLRKGIEIISYGVTNLYNLFSTLKSIIGAAFRDIFPKSETSKLIEFATAFTNFTEKLKMGGETVDKIKSIFRGLFAAFDIGKAILFGIVGLFGEVFKHFSGAGGGVLDFAANLGEAVVRLDEFLVKGNGLAKVFGPISRAIQTPIVYLVAFKNALLNIFEGVPHFKGLEVGLGRVGQRVDELGGAAKRIGDAWNWLGSRLEGVRKVLSEVGNYISNWFKELGHNLAAAMKPGDFNAVMDALNISLLGGLGLMLRKFFKDGFKLDFNTGIIDKIKGSFDGLTKTLQSMQIKLKAEAILKIAIAVGVLTVSIVALSMIDSAKLTKALVAISVSFGELVGVMTALDKLVGSAGSAAKLGILAAALIGIATAIGILTLAIKNLSSLSWNELAKGLTGVGVGLGLLIAATRLISSDSEGLIRAGIAMGAMSIALYILSKAVQSFATMSWGEIAKGLTSVYIGLALIVQAMNMMPKEGMVSAGASIVLIATGLRILANAVQAFADMKFGEMAKGLIGIAVGLRILVGAMNAMPTEGMVATGAGLILVSSGLYILAKAVGEMGSIKFGDLAKGLGAITILLVELAVALTAMTGTAAGAAALLVASAAFFIFTKVLEALGQLSIAQLVTGLIAIAGVMAVLGLGAAVLEPVIPALLGLGVAIGLVGLGFALFGEGAMLVGKAFEIIAKSGLAGAKAIVEIIKVFITARTEIVKAFAEALIGLAKELLRAAPVLLKLVTVLLLQILDTVIQLVPKIAEALGVIITAFLKLVRDKFPDILETGAFVLLTLLQGIKEHAGELITAGVEMIFALIQGIVNNMPTIILAAANLIVSFLTELSKHAQDLVAAGLGLIVSILNGISNNVGMVVGAIENLIVSIIKAFSDAELQFITAGVNILIALLKGITDNLVKVIDTVATVITTFITEIGKKAIDIAKAGTDTLVAFLTALTEDSVKIVTAVIKLAATIVKAIGDQWLTFIDAGAKALVKFLEGLGRDVNAMLKAGVDLVLKVLEGAASDAVRFADKAGDILVKFLNGMADAIRKHTPELRKAGINIAGAIADGMTMGLASKAGDVVNKAKGIAGGVVDSFKGIFKSSSPSKVFMKIGADVMEGLSIGLVRNASAQKSAVATAEQIVKNFHETLKKMPDKFDNMGEFNPVIVPVLDLTNVKAKAKLLDEMLATSSISPDVSFNHARMIAFAESLNRSTQDANTYSGPREVKFEQHNYSPQALRVNDIYRNTKSQIALAKEELNLK